MSVDISNGHTVPPDRTVYIYKIINVYNSYPPKNLQNGIL